MMLTLVLERTSKGEIQWAVKKDDQRVGVAWRNYGGGATCTIREQGHFSHGCPIFGPDLLKVVELAYGKAEKASLGA